MRTRLWLTLSVLALVGVLMLAVFPARTLAAQRRERTATAARVRKLAAANSALEDQARLLQTDAEIERLAREKYNLVRPGESVFAILPPATAAPSPVEQVAPTSAGTTRTAALPWWRSAVARLTDVF
ncbi:MAG: septum formation initiator family protein [Acidimicrobiales bacterium]